MKIFIVDNILFVCVVMIFFFYLFWMVVLIGSSYVICLSTDINSEMNDLERKRILVEEQRQTMKKLEQEDLRAQ